MSDEINQLIKGNEHFRHKFFNKKNAFFDSLVTDGQKPKVMIIACSDSRVDPALLFNCQPGQLFMIRNVANLVPLCEFNDAYHGTSAALEFGVSVLDVTDIIVLGHSQCGGIQSLIESIHKKNQPSSQFFISKWMKLVRPLCEKIVQKNPDMSLQEQIDLCEKNSIINSVQNLRTFPFIDTQVQTGYLTLHAWYFDLAAGSFTMYDKNTRRWVNNLRA